MKNKIIYSLMVLSLAGCNNFLDYNEYDFLNKDDVFKTYSRTLAAVNSLYGVIPDEINDVDGSLRSSATDDAFEVDPTRSIHIMGDGRWNAVRTVDDVWAAMYDGIRSANTFLENFDPSILDDYHYNDDYQDMVLQFGPCDEQARFLRAYYYFELLKRYGQVPLLGDKVITMEEVNSLKPNTFDEVAAYITSECDAIVDGLPVDYSTFTGDQKGRATKGCALALKARMLLYAASPLNNSNNDREKWIAAAKASYQIIASGWYILEPNYKNIVNNSASKELIFGIRRNADNYFEVRNFPVGYVGALPGNCPTQNLVDSYRMKNGMKIDNPGSGYDPSNPYVDRDPRLAETVILNNSVWKGRNCEIWNGGMDGMPKQYASETGYYLKKYVVETVNLDPSYKTTAKHLVVLFRYGEVLLNYAEAMNEAYGPDYTSVELNMSAYDAINKTRTRGGMPGFAAGMAKEQFREELRNERRVELAFEDHRFWDIRRWKIGSQTTQIRGVSITRHTDGTFLYTPKVIETRIWDEKMNLYPIPQSELFKNKNLVQNPGW